jgi:hypothetical protein
MTRGLFSNLGWVVGIGALLFLAGTGSSFAGGSVPEMDPGSAAGGIALVVCAALLIVERFRSHR